MVPTGDSPKNINLHGAVLHVIGDLVQSIGVAVAGLVIWIKNVRLGLCCGKVGLTFKYSAECQLLKPVSWELFLL